MKALSMFRSRGFSPARQTVAAVSLVLLLVSTVSTPAAIPWWKQYDPDLTIMQNPTIKTLHSDDFSQGFVMTGISDFRDFNTFQTTAIGARFDSEGHLRWGAFLEGGTGSRLQRVVGLSDLEHFFAGYIASDKVRVGIYNGLTMEKRFAHEFDVRAASGDPQDVAIGLYAGNIIGIAQHLGNETVHVMLLDEHGNKLVDRDYSGLTDPFSRPAELRFQRLPDETGFLFTVPGHIVCLENNGDIRWAQSGPFFPGILPPAIGPDGSVVFTRPWPVTPETPEGGVFMMKLNSDGSFAWARRIDGIVPEFDVFLMGRNPVHDGENIWLVGSDLDDNAHSIIPTHTFAALVRLDAASGDILAQADISIEDKRVVGEFAGWTGTHALFSIDSYTPPSRTWRQGNLLKVDGTFENPELLTIHASVETTRVSYDAATASLLYTSTMGNGRIFSAASLDAATLEPGGFCEPPTPIEPVNFTHTPASRESVVVTGIPPFEDSPITSEDAGTAFGPTDFSLAPLTFSVADGCVVGGPRLYFNDWAAEVFGAEANDPAIAGPDVDLTGNGVTNLQAYAFGLDPWANNPSVGVLPVHDSTGFAVTFRVRGNLPPFSLRVEASYDMIHWDAPFQIETSPPDEDGMVTATVRLGESPTEPKTGFVRIVVEDVEP